MPLHLDIPSRRRLLKRHTAKMIWPLSISTGVTFIAYQACLLTMDQKSALVLATGVLCALFVLALAASLWMQTEPRALRMLVLRPKYVRAWQSSAGMHSSPFQSWVLLLLGAGPRMPVLGDDPGAGAGFCGAAHHCRCGCVARNRFFRCPSSCSRGALPPAICTHCIIYDMHKHAPAMLPCSWRS